MAAGIDPCLLSESGLSVAFSVLVARCPTPVALVSCEQRLPATIEAAVYFVCSEGLANVAKHAAATQASIAVTVVDAESPSISATTASVVPIPRPARGCATSWTVSRRSAERSRSPATSERASSRLPLGDER